MRRWKIILSFVLVFLTGALVGGALTVHLAHEHFLKPPKASEMTERLMREFQSELKLTPEQVEKIRPIVAQSTSEAEAYHQQTFARFQEIFDQADEAIRSQLSDEQKALFEKFKARHPKPPEADKSK